MYPDDIVPIEEIALAMQKLIEQGKIRGYGLSEASPNQIMRAHKVCPIAAVQQEWSLFARDLEDEIVPLCRKLGISIVAYSPIARGLLGDEITRTPSDWRATVPYMTSENITQNRDIVAKVRSIAKKKGVSVAQICLAWVQAKGGIPIPGTTKLSHAKSNQESAHISLDSNEIQSLGKVCKGVRGMRGDERYMASSFHAHK